MTQGTHQANSRRATTNLLRIVLMLMVVTLHYLYRYDMLLVPGRAASSPQKAGMLVESLAIVGTNVFVLLSGYLRVKRPFRAGRVIELIATVFFYGAGIFVIAHLTGFAKAEDGLFTWLQSLLPLSSNSYWFMTSLLLVLMLSPVLNAGVLALPKKHLQTVLFFLFIWCSLIKSVVPVNFASDDMGYGLRWFVCLYVLGAYLRLYVAEKDGANTASDALRPLRGRALCAYIVSCLAIYGLSFFLHAYHADTGRLTYYVTAPLHYNYVLVLTASVGFFLWFLSLDVREDGIIAKCASRLSPYVLGAYLLHAHPLLFDRWHTFTEKITGAQPAKNALPCALHLIATVLLVFFAGILADLMRSLLFRAVKSSVKSKKSKTRK